MGAWVVKLGALVCRVYNVALQLVSVGNPGLVGEITPSPSSSSSCCVGGPGHGRREVRFPLAGRHCGDQRTQGETTRTHTRE